MRSVVDLLTSSEPWLQYALRLNLLHEPNKNLVSLRSGLLTDPKIMGLLSDVNDYHAMIVSGHKNPDLPIHKLLFLLDLGLDTHVPEIKHAIDAILEHKDLNGVYQSAVNLPAHFGGSNENTFGWALCDAPLLLNALIEAKVDYVKLIKPGVDYLVSLNRNNGFPCAVSTELGKWRGPGKKDDGCPYATLSMLKLLLATPDYSATNLPYNLAINLLELWETSLASHPYMFFMGTDFRKLKAPMIWYDVVSVCDALSEVKGIKEDMRFKEMIAIIRDKQDSDGMFTPESVYLKCKEWDFGQKNTPSPYLTYLIIRIMDRIEK